MASAVVHAAVYHLTYESPTSWNTFFFQINRVYLQLFKLQLPLPRSHLHLKFLFPQFTSSSIMMNENDNDNNNNNNNNNNNEKEDECLVLSFVYGHSLNIRKRYWWPGTW